VLFAAFKLIILVCFNFQFEAPYAMVDIVVFLERIRKMLVRHFELMALLAVPGKFVRRIVFFNPHALPLSA
jgi:hypothetical protein